MREGKTMKGKSKFTSLHILFRIRSALLARSTGIFDQVMAHICKILGCDQNKKNIKYKIVKI